MYLYFDPNDAVALSSKISLLSNEDLRKNLATTAYEKAVSSNFNDSFYKKVTNLITT